MIETAVLLTSAEQFKVAGLLSGTETFGAVTDKISLSNCQKENHS